MKIGILLRNTALLKSLIFVITIQLLRPTPSILGYGNQRFARIGKPGLAAMKAIISYYDSCREKI